MIERFNFFDVYGYLLPGGLLMVLTWLPFGLISGRWRPRMARNGSGGRGCLYHWPPFAGTVEGGVPGKIRRQKR